MSPDTLAVLAVGVALAGLQLALFRDLKGDIRELRREHGERLAAMESRLAEYGERLASVESRLGDQGERLARIEGAVLGPARPEPPKEPAP